MEDGTEGGKWRGNMEGGKEEEQQECASTHGISHSHTRVPHIQRATNLVDRHMKMPDQGQDKGKEMVSILGKTATTPCGA